MDILIITSEIGNEAGGLALTCNQTKNILEELGYNIYIENSKISNLAFTINGGYNPNLSNNLNYSFYIKNLTNKYQTVDVIIAYGAGKNSYLASLIAKKLKKKFIIVLCGSDINISFNEIENYDYNYHSLKAADKIIGLSEELVKNSKLIYKKEESNYEVVPNFYEFKDDFLYKNINLDSLNFAIASAFLNEKKGISNFIKAFSKYCKKYNRLSDKLYLFGQIDNDIKEMYQKIINDLDMKNNIVICGYLNKDEYLKNLDYIDIYIQSSYFEGCCNSVGEAIALGKFIFISDTGYFSEIIKSSFPNVIMESLEVEEIPNLLNQYIKNINKYDYRKDLYKYLKTFLNKNIILDKWKDMIQESRSIIMSESNHVVMFHDIENSYTGLDYHRKGFENLVELVYSKGYKFCSYEEYSLSNSRSNLIICTFDDGYESVYKNAFPIMKKYGFTATVFVCPDLIGKNNDWNRRDIILRYHMDLNMLKLLKEYNWEIGSHGLGHYNLLRLSQIQLENNLNISKLNLEAMFGKVNCFCYPFGDFNLYIKGLVSKYYDFAFSVNIGGNNFENDRYQFIRLVPEELKKIMEKI